MQLRCRYPCACPQPTVRSMYGTPARVSLQYSTERQSPFVACTLTSQHLPQHVHHSLESGAIAYARQSCRRTEALLPLPLRMPSVRSIYRTHAGVPSIISNNSTHLSPQQRMQSIIVGRPASIPRKSTVKSQLNLEEKQKFVFFLVPSKKHKKRYRCGGPGPASTAGPGLPAQVHRSRSTGGSRMTPHLTVFLRGGPTKDTGPTNVVYYESFKRVKDKTYKRMSV